MSQQLGTVSTTVSKDDTHTVVTYHQTQIVRFNDSEIILNSGGWHTATTKTRMNQASNQFGLGYRVYQKDFEWFVEMVYETAQDLDGSIIRDHRSLHPFCDNMIIRRRK